MRFLVDAQLPPALARRIESLGHGAEHLAACSLEKASDADVRARAVKVGAVIVTKDEDFAVHQVLHDGPAVVWVRVGNTRRAELLRRLDAELPDIVRALERGETLVELT